MLLAFAITQPFIWFAWDSPLGDSLKNLVSYSQLILSTLCVIGWWFLFAPVKVRTRLLVGIPILLLLMGWIGSIRRVNFDGDMKPHLVYRWQPTAMDRIAALQSQTRSTSSGGTENLILPVIQAEDSPAYRGARRDGIVTGPSLNQDWSARPPKELWRHPCGAGYSSFAVVGPYALTLEQRGPNEAVVCYDAASGQQLWVHEYPAAFDEAMGGPGPRSTPTVHDDAVYTFGAFGDLCCVGLVDGKLRWHVNSLEQFQTPNTIWAMTSSPLIDQNRVIINIGGRSGNGLVAYDLQKGSVIWHGKGLSDPLPTKSFKTGVAAVSAAGKSVPGYSSPMLATLHGLEQILIFDGTAIRGLNRDDGAQFWSFPFEAGDNVSVAQPVVFPDGRIFIAASYGKGAVMLQVQHENHGWSVEELWSNLNMRCKFTSPVLFENNLYGLDEGLMVCLNPADGKRRWKGGKSGLRGRYGHGQILLTNGQILVLSESGEAVLLQASPGALEELTSMRVLPEGKTWNPPVLVRGRLYVRNASEMACYDLNLPVATASLIAD
jgi:outer membrane protein assembly factor BamB